LQLIYIYLNTIARYGFCNLELWLIAMQDYPYNSTTKEEMVSQLLIWYSMQYDKEGQIWISPHIFGKCHNFILNHWMVELWATE